MYIQIYTDREQTNSNFTTAAESTTAKEIVLREISVEVHVDVDTQEV